MEVIIPLLAMSGLYVSTGINANERLENFTSSRLPNVDIADRNYNPEGTFAAESDRSSKLSKDNAYDGQRVYTDKYFNSNMNSNKVNSNSDTGIEAQYTSLTGESVSASHFQHNNMVPFFAGNIRSRINDMNANESVLDNYVGSGSQSYSKKEQAPLFAPKENQQWANGTPNNTEFMRSRVNPSSKMANVNPFKQEQVGPGLGLGYTTDGGGGFNSGMAQREAWTAKTVDELRVLTNPKAGGVSIIGREGPANSHIKQMGHQGIQEKHRPDTSFEMTKDRYFTTTGAQKGQTLRSTHIDKDVSRPSTAVEYAGGAGYYNTSLYVDGEHMPTHKQQLDGPAFTPAGAKNGGSATASDYGIKSKKVYPNNRTTTTNDKYFGAVGGAFGAAVAPLLDVLRPSKKENTVGNLRPYQKVKASVASSYLYDHSQHAAPTIRQTTEVGKFHPLMNANQNGGGYKVSEHQVAHTSRSQTSRDYTGGSSASAGRQDTRSYAAEYNQRNNEIKSSTVNNGRTPSGNMKLFTADVNMSAKHKDRDLINSRSLTKNMPTPTPSIHSMGTLSGGNSLNQNINMERNTPDLTSVLGGNPFVIPYSVR
jgi:hypothetical protein